MSCWLDEDCLYYAKPDYLIRLGIYLKIQYLINLKAFGRLEEVDYFHLVKLIANRIEDE